MTAPTDPLTTTEADRREQWRDLAAMIRDFTVTQRRFRDNGFTSVEDQRICEILKIQMDVRVAHLFPTYDETTRARMIAFAVGVMG